MAGYELLLFRVLIGKGYLLPEAIWVTTILKDSFNYPKCQDECPVQLFFMFSSKAEGS